MNPQLHTNGLVFRKLDLHLHTKASSCFGDRACTAQQIVDRALEQGLSGIAITDHNSAASIREIQEAAKNTSLVIFPGAELTCMGIHIVALFDPSQGQQHVEALLGGLGLKPEQFGDQHTTIAKTPQQVCEEIVARGGLAVLAHVNSTNGALDAMRGQSRIALIQCPQVAAAEATDFHNAAKTAERKRACDLLDGSDPAYKRSLAVYQASDNPDGINDGTHGIAGIGTRCSWFKVDRINLEGIRQCFNDPLVRIRQDFEHRTNVYPVIKTITITGGFLDGSTATFHEGLNSVLGGKGTGKSLLVELMRFGLGQPPENPGILEDHFGKLEARLEEFGRVELTLSDETGKEFRIRRELNAGEGNPFDPPDRTDIARAFPVLFLSQNEIIKVAEDEVAQIGFIDRFFDFRSYTARIRELEQDLELRDAQVAEAIRAFEQVKIINREIQVLKDDLGKVDQLLKSPIFDEFRKLELKNRSMTEFIEYAKAQVSRIAGFKAEFQDDTIPVIPEDFSEDPGLRRIKQAVEDNQLKLIQHLDDMSDLATRTSANIVGEQTKYLPTLKAGKEKYESVIQTAGGDYKALAAKRGKLVKDLESQSAKLTQVKARSDRMKTAVDERKVVLEQLRKTYSAYSQERLEKCVRFESESVGRLQVRIHESSNKDAFRQKLLSLKKGSYLKDSEIEAICQAVDPIDFINGVLRYALQPIGKSLDQVQSASGLDPVKLVKFVDFLLETMSYEELLSLQYQVMPQDRPEILYDIGSPEKPKYEPLKRLSIGQKCTAMLIMALSDGAMPIVIDQPEDSLDIRSVWDDMCQKVRRGKDRRQFIFTTHNSSLAVASDSDKFVIMEGDADRGRVAFSGSMDHGPVSDEVLKHLEGGIETYRLKYGKYDAERRARE